ncbi:unnamed protein product [Sphagnum balticum]
MNNILVMRPHAADSPYLVSRSAQTKYEDDLGRWAGGNPFRSLLSGIILASGGFGAKSLSFNFASEIPPLPPPFPPAIRFVELTFQASNTSRVYDSLSQNVHSAFDAIDASEQPEAPLHVRANFQGHADVNTVLNLFSNLFFSLSMVRQQRLTLDSPETGAFPFSRAQAHEDADLQRAMTASSASAGDASRRVISDQYHADGGLKADFASRRPTDEQSGAIRESMQRNLEKLKHQDGLKIDNGKISLDEGQCPLSLDDFDPEENAEWCLLRTGDAYTFVKAGMMEESIKAGYKHPLRNDKLLESSDLVRGKAVLDLLEKAEKESATDPTTPVPDPVQPAGRTYPVPSAPPLTPTQSPR